MSRCTTHWWNPAAQVDATCTCPDADAIRARIAARRRGTLASLRHVGSEIARALTRGRS